MLVIVLADDGTRQPWTKVFFPWDGGYYLGIAKHGYGSPAFDHPDGDLSTAFFPLFSLTVRFLSALLHVPILGVGVALNLILGGLSVVLVHRLAASHLGADQALRAGLLFVALPGGVIFALFYADALLVALAAATLLMIQRHAWVSAGLLGMAATATRPNAFGLVVATAVASFLAIRREKDLRSLFAPILTPLGGGAYLAWLGVRTGDPLAWFHIQGHWDQGLDFGYHYAHVLRHHEALQDPSWRVMALGFLYLLLAGWCVWKGARLDPVIGSYTLALVAQMLLFSGVAPRPRFLLLAFPLTWLIAQRVSRPWVWVLIAIGTTGGLVLAYVYAAEVAIP